MSAESRYRRLMGQFYRFEGNSDGNGNVFFPPRQTNIPDLSEVSEKMNGNGNKEKDPFASEIIYQALKIE